MADSLSVAIRTCECVWCALHQLLLRTMHMEQMEVRAARGKAGAKLEQSWSRAANSVNPSLVRLPLTLHIGYTRGWSATQPCLLAQGLDSVLLVR